MKIRLGLKPIEGPGNLRSSPGRALDLLNVPSSTEFVLEKRNKVKRNERPGETRGEALDSLNALSGADLIPEKRVV